jgi:AcrR family transcriptional regulator
MPSVPSVRRRRVAALAPDDRRAALISATIPLLRERGLDVSTKQIAEAAGVAEGTIFGVFRDKNTLLAAAVMHALNPTPTLDAIAGVDPSADLRTRLTAAADLIIQRFRDNAELMTAARKLVLATDAFPEARVYMAAAREQMQAAVATVIQPDAHRLRESAGSTARLLLLLCGANIHGPYGDPDRLTAADMVSLLLDGLLIRTDNHGGPERC